MAYTALYRRFRPQRFEDVVGQEHIVRTLQNQLESGRITHAYLFAGPRGTGKTTTAKLFARAINCEACENGEPCGKCPSCLAGNENVDIAEIDAASNNGVENIRDIRDKVAFAPVNGKYKVYIIDEVHMLSPGAFNALLKTLEEPPAHAVFILATTEIHKLPATILSRCQRFDFRLIPTPVIVHRLKTVLAETGAEFADEAVALIARSAEGGMRDALSLADVCLSYCGSRVTAEDAMRVLGISDRSFLFGFTDALLAGDCAAALGACRALTEGGKDIGVFVRDEMAHLRDLLVTVYAPESESVATLPADVRKTLAEQAKKADPQRLLRGIEILSALEGELKMHTRPEIQLEVAAVRICTPETERDYSALCDRVAALEAAMKNGAPTVQAAEKKPAEDVPPWETNPAPQAAEKKPAPAPKPAQAAASVPAAAATRAVPAKAGLWEKLLASLKAEDLPFYMMLRNFRGVRQENKFTIYIPASAATRRELIERRSDFLSAELEKACGEKLSVHVSTGEAPAEEKKESSGEPDLMQAALDLFS